jgi:hypothetical protein
MPDFADSAPRLICSSVQFSSIQEFKYIQLQLDRAHLVKPITTCQYCPERAQQECELTLEMRSTQGQQRLTEGTPRRWVSAETDS